MIFSSNKRNGNTLGLFSAQHRKRYRQVIFVLSKYGLVDFLDSKKLKQSNLIKKTADPKYKDLSKWVRLRLAMEELGGAYVKLGQVLSNRSDLLPPELLEELEKLHDAVPPFSSQVVIQIIEDQLEQSLGDLFLMFDDEPLASASISQVHRAVMYDLTPVVVKVQRPEVAQSFKIDMDVLEYLSTHLAKVPKLKSQFQNGNPVKEIRAELEKELDFLNEASNIKAFANNFSKDKRVYVPQVYFSYSTKSVLTMEYVSGIKVTDSKKFKDFNTSAEKVAGNLVELGLSQIFEHRYFHGDPHPGNIFVLENGQICFIDFGLMGRVSLRQRQAIVDLITAFSQNDPKKLTRIASRYIPAEKNIDEDVLEEQISELLDLYYDKNIGEINVGEALQKILDLIFSYDLTLKPNMYLLLKSVLLYEGIGKKIYPEFELAPYAEKFTKKIIAEKLSPTRIFKDIYTSSADALALVKDLPTEIRAILNQVQAGKFTVNVGVKDLDSHLDFTFNRIDKIVNKLVVAIVLSAMLLSSSLILRSSESVIGADRFPIIAGLGFFISLLMGMYLVWSFLRKN